MNFERNESDYTFLATRAIDSFTANLQLRHTHFKRDIRCLSLSINCLEHFL